MQNIITKSNMTPPISNLVVNRDAYTCELQHLHTQQAAAWCMHSVLHRFGEVRRCRAQVGACPGPKKDAEGLCADIVLTL